MQAEIVAERLKQCACMLAFITPEYVKSGNCRGEIHMAIDSEKEVVPIYLQDLESLKNNKMWDGIRLRISPLGYISRADYSSEEKFLEKLAKEKLLRNCRESQPPLSFDDQEFDTEEIQKAEEDIPFSPPSKHPKFKRLIRKHAETIDTNKPQIAQTVSLENAEVGGYITFGIYEQDNDTAEKEPIRWKVLDKQGDELLIISEKILDCVKYNEGYVDVTWETCALRVWLNEDFLNDAFTEEEQERIIEKTITNPDNPVWGTEGGEDTEDKVFLLSIEEAEKYFKSDEERMAEASELRFQGAQS